MASVFVSYSHKDRGFVGRLVDDLCGQNIPVWVDWLSIPPGKPWDDAIQAGLKSASHLLVVMSNQSMQSQNVLDEMHFGIETKKQLIPVLIETCRIPFWFVRFQYVDFRQDYDRGLPILLKAAQSEENGSSATNLWSIPPLDPQTPPLQIATIITTQGKQLAEAYESLRVALASLATPANTSTQWRPVAFDQETDEALAAVALNQGDPQIARTAASVCANIRSEAAVTYLAQKASTNHPQAFQALVWLRDEVPALPSFVLSAIRQRVFVLLSMHQFFDQPLSLIERYAYAALGAGLGIGIVIYGLFHDPLGLRLSQRLTTALGMGFQYGILIGVGILIAVELTARLRAWTRWGRAVFAGAAGALSLSLAFALLHQSFYERLVEPVTLIGSTLVMCGGFVLASLLTTRTWLRMAISAVAVFAAVYGGWKIFPATSLIDFRGSPNEELPLSLLLALVMGILTYAPELLNAFAEWSLRRRHVESPAQ